MEKMLIRTSGVSKYKVAVLIRIVLFFGIPTFYLLFVTAGILEHKPENAAYEKSNFVSRNLLSIPEGVNCTKAAILEFPPDGLTRYQRQHGYIIIHCVLAIYCFLLLGTVCERYFVPAIEIICKRLNLASDVAGATFMAAASSSPELFINCVGTFVTQGDLGVGAVVGSAVFNVLAVPACCALFAGKVIDLDWWSVSRDCMMYAVAVIALILSLIDDRVYWNEALVLVLMYTFYILAMVFNEELGRFARSVCCIKSKSNLYTEVTPLLIKDKNFESAGNLKKYNEHVNNIEKGVETPRRPSTESDLSGSSLWSWPDEKVSTGRKLLWFFTWPICLVLWLTIPDCRRHQNLYPITFILCITWIGGVSYLVAWIITIVGDTLNLPDSITGLTMLAAGTSLPEAVSSVLVTIQGFGTMGISNSIGSNTFDILLCLGLPWLIKALWYPTDPGNHWVTINSSGLSYSAISLLTTLIAFYVSLAINDFQLDWKIGVTCTVIYAGFLALAALIELNMLFVVNLPTCPH